MDREQDRADIAEAYIELHDELDKALAAHAELASHLSFAVKLLKSRRSPRDYQEQVAAMEDALTKHTQAKGV